MPKPKEKVTINREKLKEWWRTLNRWEIPTEINPLFELLRDKEISGYDPMKAYPRGAFIVVDSLLKYYSELDRFAKSHTVKEVKLYEKGARDVIKLVIRNLK